ncbi:hypothetical protein CC77DRAFT_246822 [Alternaria alternata]|uniref:Secreted protein n=1 Tax=Alternaria alternata TaxID=5599 RepID=A0A177DFY5_ALTAL|nr:hypothetical protein CC77DRAFT_246822 [Alternaria alternata]OAG17992.1 hypothetical protein CC77DRAFT_246822 [Alternaria alternata]
MHLCSSSRFVQSFLCCCCILSDLSHALTVSPAPHSALGHQRPFVAHRAHIRAARSPACSEPRSKHLQSMTCMYPSPRTKASCLHLFCRCLYVCFCIKLLH